MNRISTIATAAAFGLGSLLCGVQPAQAYQCRYVSGARICGDADTYSIDWPDGSFLNGACGSGVRRRV